MLLSFEGPLKALGSIANIYRFKGCADFGCQANSPCAEWCLTLALRFRHQTIAPAGNPFVRRIIGGSFIEKSGSMICVLSGGATNRGGCFDSTSCLTSRSSRSSLCSSLGPTASPRAA